MSVRPAAVLAALAALAGAPGLHAAAQEPKPGADAPVFPVSAHIVWIDAVAIGADDEPVLALASEDFQVLVAGQPRPIVLFRAPQPASTEAGGPVGAGRAVAFLLEDALAAPWHVARARELALRAIARARPGDRIVVVAPLSRVATSALLPDGRTALEQALGRVRAGSRREQPASARVAAIEAALEALRGHTGPRALVVLGPPLRLHQGAAAGAALYERVMRASQRVAAPVYFLKWGEDDDPPAESAASPGRAPGDLTLAGLPPVVPMAAPELEPSSGQALDAAAADSGGFSARGPAAWQWSIDRVLKRTRSAYLVGIPAPPESWDGRYHPIEVRVVGHDVRVLARRGYFAPKPAGR